MPLPKQKPLLPVGTTNYYNNIHKPKNLIFMKKIFTLIAAAVAALSVNAQDWNATNSGSLTKGTTLLDNDYVTVTTGVQDSEAAYIKDESEQNDPKTYAGYTFKKYINVRVTDAPSSDNNWEGSEYTDCTPVGISLIVTAKVNTDITFYYKHGDGKVLSVLDQTLNESKVNTETAVADLDGYYTGTVKMQGGHKYTIYAKGGTVGINGITTAEGTYVEPTSKTYGYTASTNEVTYGDGAKMAITGNTSKNFGSAAAIKGITSIKNSNGAQNTFWAPEGKYASSVTFYFAANADDTEAKLSEINGVQDEYASAVGKIHSNPTSYTYTFESPVSQFTFTFSNKQCNFIMEVAYADAAGIQNIAATTVSAKAVKYVKDGQLVIETAKGTFTAAGARLK